MAPIKLPCLVGGDCNFETVELEYEQAKAQQDAHMQYAHGAAAGQGAGAHNVVMANGRESEDIEKLDAEDSSLRLDQFLCISNRSVRSENGGEDIVDLFSN